ncbi:MAG: hypothetical protein NVSMB51_17730 [Solirubrobacteraceae bacterium]
MTDWFAVREVVSQVWEITEPGHVSFWLVAGERRAALIDTGCGFAPLRGLVERLCDRPVFVLNSHNHIDHVGGNAEWDEVAIHALGADGLEREFPREMLDAYRRHADAMAIAFTDYRRLDRGYFHLLPSRAPVRTAPAVWRIQPSRATSTVADGDVLDLGGRSLRVLHTPGHAPDCLCFELVGERLLIGGDTVNTGPVYLQLPDSDLRAQRRSLARLADARARGDRVLCAHFMRTEVHPNYLVAQVEALDTLLAGRVTLEPAVDCLGMPVSEARFEGFSLLVA